MNGPVATEDEFLNEDSYISVVDFGLDDKCFQELMQRLSTEVEPSSGKINDLKTVEQETLLQGKSKDTLETYKSLSKEETDESRNTSSPRLFKDMT